MSSPALTISISRSAPQSCSHCANPGPPRTRTDHRDRSTATPRPRTDPPAAVFHAQGSPAAIWRGESDRGRAPSSRPRNSHHWNGRAPSLPRHPARIPARPHAERPRTPVPRRVCQPGRMCPRQSVWKNRAMPSSAARPRKPGSVAMGLRRAAGGIRSASLPPVPCSRRITVPSGFSG